MCITSKNKANLTQCMIQCILSLKVGEVLKNDCSYRLLIVFRNDLYYESLTYKDMNDLLKNKSGYKGWKEAAKPCEHCPEGKLVKYEDHEVSATLMLCTTCGFKRTAMKGE